MLEFDPEIESALSDAGWRRGLSGLWRRARSVSRRVRALDWQARVREIRDLGDRVVALGELSIRGKKSGIEAQSAAGRVVDMKDAKAVRITEYLDPAEALEAAGLSEYGVTPRPRSPAERVPPVYL